MPARRADRSCGRKLTGAVVATLLLGGCSGGGTAAPAPSTPSTPSSAASASRSATPSASKPPASSPASSSSASGTPSPSSTAGPDASVRVAGTIATGLRAPWGLAFLPDGSALVAERDEARIVRVPAAGGEPQDIGEVPDVDPGGEGGLLGLAVSPRFAQDHLVFAYATASEDNRVLRMRLDGDRLSEPDVVLRGIDKAAIHNGGRLAFGPDGYLYVATGDAGGGDNAQDKDSLNGKILRITTDGKPAPGNPFGNEVWSLGHRNVQGLGWDSRGRLWASEFGQNTWDELNLIEKGHNYGWPQVEGDEGVDNEDFTRPQAKWPTSDNSPSGIAVAGGAVYMAALRGARLWQVPIDGDSAGEPRDFLSGDYGRLRTVVLAPDGSVWLTTSNTDSRGQPRDGDDRILRLTLG